MKVRELIEQLKQAPDEAEVVILDADTGWHLPIEYAGNDAKEVERHAQDNMGFDADSVMRDDGIYITEKVFIVGNYFSRGY